MDTAKLKIPYQLDLTIDQAKLYAQFLDFKSYNPQGRLTPADFGRIKSQRVSNRYWLEKLVSAGWAYKDGKAYCMRSYKHVWTSLSIAPRPESEDRFYFYKLKEDKLALDKKTYTKQIIQHLLERTVANKLRRMKYAKKTDTIVLGKRETSGFFGVRSAAKLFGRKSPATGAKYRDKFFSVIKEPRKVYRTSNIEYDKWSAEFMYKCDKILL